VTLRSVVGAGALLLAGCAAVPVAAPHRPNVVVFLVDDLGWLDASEPFHRTRTPQNDRFRTPNLERLCRQGTKFVQAYAHPVCTPSRVSLLTGMAAARHRVTHWTLRTNTPTDPERDGLRRPEWNVNGL
jgi:arylsulfatase A-like enzyme